MLRALFAVAVLVLAASASILAVAGPTTRWTTTSVEGAHALFVAGRESASLVLLRTNLDPLRSFDGGATWTPFRVANQIPAQITVSPTDRLLWYATVAPVTYRTRDGGNTWTPLGMHAGQIPRVAHVGADPGLVYAYRFGEGGTFPSGVPPVVGVLQSTDDGDTWRELAVPGTSFHSFTPSAADSRVLWISSFESDGVNLYRTADGGATWTKVSPPRLSEFDRYGATIVPDRRDASIAYARPLALQPSGSERIWRTSDGGATWILGEDPGIWLVADPLQAGRAYATGLDDRVSETRDAGASWALVNVGASAHFFPFAPVMLASGSRRIAIRAYDAKISRIDLTDGALALGSDLWWNPAESGAGLTITQHAGNGTFVVWYTYDATGAPVWRVIPGGTWSDRTLTGPMYETTGPAYFSGAFDPDDVQVRAVGTATLRFDDEDNAVFAYSVGGVSGEKPITRQLFAPPAPPTGEDFADLWWNPSESGWGIAINHQHNRIFATWYVYGNDGKPIWVVMPDAVIGTEFVGAIVRPVATGDIYTTRGPASGSPFDPAQVVPTRIGSATLRFSSTEQATLEYTAFGRTESRTITRQPF